MELIKLDIRKSGIELTAEAKAEAARANELLYSGKGAGNDFLGWVNLPSSISADELASIKAQAERLRAKADVVVCIGIEWIFHLFCIFQNFVSPLKARRHIPFLIVFYP